MTARIPQSVREEQLNSLPGILFVRWVDFYRNKNSKAVVCCVEDHEWKASVDSLLSGRGCPKCAGKYRYSAAEREGQLAMLPNMRFVRWVSGYKNQKSKVVMVCAENHEWDATVDHLLRGKGCPQCAGNQRRPAVEREKQIAALPGMSFVGWQDGYKNRHKSKALMVCDKHHEWAASVDDLLRGRGCPQCARYGFNLDGGATLYALRSECGEHVKIGITGDDPRRRISELSRASPFAFSTVALVSGVGRDIRALEKSFHRNFESSGFSGFDGATEWLKFNPDILTLMRTMGA